jgi:calcium-dependent protein kinase
MENEGDTLTLTKDNLIQRSYADLETNYEIVDELGCGAYARVLKVKNKNTHIEYACKELLKSDISDIESFNKEISILSTLDHPNII